MNTQTAYIEVGKLGRTRGVHGEIYVTPLTDFPERFVGMQRIYVNVRGEWRAFRLDSARIVSGRPVLKFEGIDTPEDAARMTNMHLAVTLDEVVPLPEDTYYVFELVGCAVIDETSGRRLGEIVDVRNYPANDVYVLRTGEGRELWLPAVKAFVRQVDIAARIVRVRPDGIVEPFTAEEGI